jgi:O-antigen ligase
MLASPPVRAPRERVEELAPGLAAAALSFCALFFGGGDVKAPLVWIGGLVLVLAALLLARRPALDAPAALLLGSLFGLAVWSGITTIWSMSPDRSWQFTNRTVVYAGFALLGVLATPRVSRPALARAAAVLLALVVGWALLAKCVPALFSDYGRVARLRSPLGYWNELALVCDAGVPVALWLAGKRRVEGVLLLYALVVTVLLTYSRFGVALACAAAAAWVVLDRRNRVESLVACALGGGAGAAVFGIALALPGITNDGEPRSARAHDGWLFALAVLAGAALVAACAFALSRREVAPARRRRIERLAGAGALLVAVAGLAASIAFAGHIWTDFTSPGSQLSNSVSHLGSAKSNRWEWWQEAWHAFTRHPGGGTGAGTFELTNQMLRKTPVVVDEPHNVPLQLLTETGLVGLLLYLGAAGGALWGAWRARRDPAGLALGLAVAVFFAHAIVDKDWNYVATCGPLFLLAGALVARPPAAEPRRRSVLLAAGAVAVALAAVYSLSAPWLADRALARADVEQAHSYNPLSVEALTDWAAFEDAAGKLAHAQQLYTDAVGLEPENASAWYALGSFYFGHAQWLLAYDALNNSYTYDRFGLAARPCGLLDQARKKAHGFVPPSASRCPGGGRSSSP